METTLIILSIIGTWQIRKVTLLWDVGEKGETTLHECYFTLLSSILIPTLLLSRLGGKFWEDGGLEGAKPQTSAPFHTEIKNKALPEERKPSPTTGQSRETLAQEVQQEKKPESLNCWV